MTIETIVIISGLILVAVLASIVLGGRKSKLDKVLREAFDLCLEARDLYDPID